MPSDKSTGDKSSGGRGTGGKSGRDRGPGGTGRKSAADRSSGGRDLSSGDRTARFGDDNPRRPAGPNFPNIGSTRVGDTNPSPFGWTSPRWRDSDQAEQGDVEKDRREHDTTAPSKDTEGAINRKGNRDQRGGSRGQSTRRRSRN